MIDLVTFTLKIQTNYCQNLNKGGLLNLFHISKINYTTKVYDNQTFSIKF